MATYDLKGLKQLEKALDLLGASASKKVLKGALRDASKPVLKEAKRLTPKDQGDVRKSLGVKVDKFGNLQLGYRLSKKYKGFVGLFLEKGTKAHTIKLSGKQKRLGRKAITTPYGPRRSVNVRGLRATPILEPAMRAKHKESIEIFKKRAYERMIIETINKSKAYK